VADDGAVLPGSLEPESFFGRSAELGALRRDARSAARGAGRSRAICARAGSGKSELLRQWHGRLFREGEILPFWYRVPAGVWETADAGGEFAAALALQALAFRRRDPALLARRASTAELAEGLRSSWGAGGVLLAQALMPRRDCRDRGEGFAAMARLPHRFASLTGTRVLCLIDDADHLAGGGPGRLWPEEATASTLAPAIFSVEDDGQPRRFCGRSVASLLTVERLGPLTADAAGRMARHLARTAGLELDSQAVAALVGESAGNPFYLGALVRELAGSPGTGALEVARASAASLCDGELARFWTERLADAIPDRRTRATALEILAFCLREGEGSPDAGRLPELMLKPEPEIDAALAGLGRAGVVRVECSRIAVDEDPVFRDAVTALYRREFGRVAPGAVVAALAADKARGAPAKRRLEWREQLRRALRDILGAWAGQRVPSILFDAAAFRAANGGGVEASQLGAAEGGAAHRLLPRVVAVTSGRVGSGLSLPGLEVDALAWGVRAGTGGADADVAWVARWLGGGSGGAEQLAQFDRDVAALQAIGELPPARVVRWALLESPLDAAGEQAASHLRMATSARVQLEALARLVGVAAALPPPPAAEGGAAAVELEMVIPRATDVELVAARALEQLAENLDVDAQVIGRLKVALVEACINAFEHSGARDGRVRLVFSVAGSRLVIRVENRGRPLAALPASARGGRESGGRGWGLTLIRELVDEVALEPREDGVSLVMVKRLGGEEHG
jgi:serine/threonine-protein kinase RsbW